MGTFVEILHQTPYTVLSWLRATLTEVCALSSAFYPMSQKKQNILLLPITLPNIDQFSQLFHQQTRQLLCNEFIIKDLHRILNALQHYLVNFHFTFTK